ncbi:basic leucine zipper transcriptional factor ATF-like 2 isoform X1 [Sigmodon hispidus]
MKKTATRERANRKAAHVRKFQPREQAKAKDSEQPVALGENETGCAGGGVVTGDLKSHHFPGPPEGTEREGKAAEGTPGADWTSASLLKPCTSGPDEEGVSEELWSQPAPHSRLWAQFLLGTDPEECQKQLKKKQKNRLAAQRSRQKHTSKADALHQEHESLEKHNHALRKEIQVLQAELARWDRTLHLHERLCRVDCGSCPVLLPSGRPVQAEQLSGQRASHGYHGCQEQLGPLQTSGSSPSAQQLSPGPCSHESPGLLPSPPSSLSFDPLMVRAPLSQLSPKPGPSASPPGSSLLGSLSKFDALIASPSNQLVPPQPLKLEHPTSRLASSSNPPAVLGPECPQNIERLPALSGSSADWQKSSVDPSQHLLTAFPLLFSAEVHF